MHSKVCSEIYCKATDNGTKFFAIIIASKVSRGCRQTSGQQQHTGECDINRIVTSKERWIKGEVLIDESGLIWYVGNGIYL